MKIRELLLRLADVGGLTGEFHLASGGVNRLVGDNGAGKSVLARIILAAFGDPEEIEITDGAALGTVEVHQVPAPDPEDGDGMRKIVVPSRGRIRVSGDGVPLSIYDMGAVTRLITGGNAKTRGTRDSERVKAFSEILRPEVDEEAIGLLTENDPDMGAWMRERVAAGALPDLLTAADKLREELHARKREKRALGEQWAGTEKVHLQNLLRDRGKLAALGEDEPLPHPDVERAVAAVTKAIRAEGEAETSAASRRRQEAAVAAIREAGAERPNVDAVWSEVHSHLSTAKAAREKVAQLGEEIAALQERQRAALARQQEAEADGRRAEAEWQRLKDQAAAWDAQQALLTKPVDGATETEVVMAAEALSEARRQEQLHRLSAAVNSAQKEADAAARQKNLAEGGEASLEQWALALKDRLADALAKKGAAGFTLVEGKLMYAIDERGPVDFEARLSFGQQVAAAVGLAKPRFKDLVYLEPAFWLGLQPKRMAEVDEFARAHPELFILAEEPKDREQIAIVHGRGAGWHGEEHGEVTGG